MSKQLNLNIQMPNKNANRIKLSKNDFNEACLSFYTQSMDLNDSWQLIQPSLPGNQLYLKKANQFINYEIDSKVQYCRADFHVIFSPGYSAPCLYFLLFNLDGSTLNIDQTYKLIEWRTLQLGTMEGIEFGGAISQGDHPILNSPYFFIHPCRTIEVLETLFINNDTCTTPYQLNKDNYLKFWIGIIGNPVGLVLDSKYYMERSY